MHVPANFLLTSIPGAHVDAVAVPRVKDGVALDVQLGLGLALHADAEAAIRRQHCLDPDLAALVLGAELDAALVGAVDVVIGADRGDTVPFLHLILPILLLPSLSEKVSFGPLPL